MIAAGLAGAELALAYTGFWLWLGLRSALDGPDFIVHYTAARLELEAGPRRLYEIALQTQIQHEITAGWPGVRILLPFLLPPWSGLAVVPFGLMGYRTAYLAMGAVTLILVGIAIAVLVRSSGERGPRAFLLAGLGAGFLPCGVLLIQGQADGVAVIGLALAARSWLRGDDARAGALAAATLVKPQLALLVPLVFVAHRSGRALAGYGLAAAVLFLLTLPFFGPGGWIDYLRLVLPGLGVGAGQVRIHSSFSVGGLLPPLLGLAVLAAGAVLVATRRGDRRGDLALAITLSLLLSPYSNAHDVVLLLPALILAAGLVPWAAAGAYLGAALMLAVGPASVLAGMALLAASLVLRGGRGGATDSPMPRLIH